jgi:hypothetical protein
LDYYNLNAKSFAEGTIFLVKEQLGKRPSRLELFTYMDDDVYQMTVSHSKENIFKAYMDYLNELGELAYEEENLYQGVGREFIYLIENANMTKVYKMPVHFLQESGKGFFVQREGVALALREDLRDVIN